MANQKDITAQEIEKIAREANNRQELVIRLIKHIGAQNVIELGVWKGRFSEAVLLEVPEISSYWMLDPWRHLETWNKPLNVDQKIFDESLREALARTEFAANRRHLLRGTTKEKIGELKDAQLDLAYIDGDHTLKGITIDLISVWPKVRAGGLIVGDDFTPSIWQHGTKFEPTMVFPFSVYFAEAQGAPIIASRHDQFIIIKPEGTSDAFSFIDLTGNYQATEIKEQIEMKPSVIFEFSILKNFKSIILSIIKWRRVPHERYRRSKT